MGGATTMATGTAIAAGAVALLSGAFLLAPGGPAEQPATAAGLTPFDGCADLGAWFADAESKASRRGTQPYAMEGAERAAVGTDTVQPGPAPGQASEGLDAGAVGPGATGTNVQEEGVDEPDLIKTSSGRVVVVRDNRLYVLDASGSVPRELGSVTLPGETASELLLSGDRVLVLGTTHASAKPVDQAEGADPAGPSAMLTLVELADPSRPTVVRTHEIQGGYVTARETNGVARVVVQSSPWLPSDRATARAEDWLPQRVERDAAGRVTATEPAVDCANVRHPAEPSGVGLITVVTLDLDRPDALDSVAVAADGELVYASADRLYVATTPGGWARPLDAMVWRGDAEPAQVRTAIHAFDMTDGKTTSYLASGDVGGWLMGRWAMSEYDGLLRVATTRGDQWGANGAAPSTDAAVTVFEERGDRLQAVGSVGGLGRGEQVRAVRWFGDVATVVTFRQTDPLYTVDLADPTQPRVMGELKVSGYSAYLHPLGNGLLLGVGQDATEQGRVLGTQVSTFDLSDLANPVPVDNLVEPRSYSDVETDSRQFTYLPELRAALLPLVNDTGSTLWSLRVADDGTLHENGRWTPGRTGQILRALPINGGRLTVLHDGGWGATLTLLEVNELRELGSARLN